MIEATIIPSVPKAFTFEGQRFTPSKQFPAHVNHLVRGFALVGIQFPCADEAGDAFLVSRFANESANAHLRGGRESERTFAELDIWLGHKADAESDQGLYLGTSMFESATKEFIIVVPCDCQYSWSDLGFEPAKDGPTPEFLP